MPRPLRSWNRLACALLAILSLSGCDSVESALFDRAAKQLAQGDRTDWLNDGGLHVILCGTGTPVADPDRAGPCVAVIAGGKFLLVDAGPGSWENVQRWQLPRSQLSGLLLTHFHSDHIAEVGEVTVQSWIGGRSQPLPVYGPAGVDSLVEGFQRAYSFDAQYRVAHHGEAAMPPSGSVARAQIIPESTGDAGTVVLDDAGVKVTAFSVDHQPVKPAVGYRVDYNGRSVVISGDTEKSAAIAHHARGADLLVHEALAKDLISQMSTRLGALGAQRLAKLTADIVDYHTSPTEAAEIAKLAGVRMLVLTHLVPAPANAVLQRLFLRGVGEVWDGEVVLGDDGMHFDLPKGSTAIRQDELD
jgi:ribonuclease Z